MSDKLRIASVGMSEKHSFFFQQLLKVYASQLKRQWLYLHNFDAEQVIFTMGSIVDKADILLIDVDCEQGKRAWYILQVLLDEHKLIALSSQPERFNTCYVIKKPCLNWSASEGAAVVGMLNNFCINNH